MFTLFVKFVCLTCDDRYIILKFLLKAGRLPVAVCITSFSSKGGKCLHYFVKFVKHAMIGT